MLSKLSPEQALKKAADIAQQNLTAEAFLFATETVIEEMIQKTLDFYVASKTLDTKVLFDLKLDPVNRTVTVGLRGTLP